MSKHVNQTIDTSVLLKLKEWAALPFEDATPLSGVMYTSPEVADLERERIFTHEWIGVGREDELTQPGDYLTLDIADYPIVVVRDKEGLLRALSNVCRHRGTVIKEGKGKAGVLTCPYHGWTYNLDGSLRAAPYMADATSFDLDQICLPEYPVESWHGFVFVNLDAEAEPLGPGLKALDQYFDMNKANDLRTVFRDHSEIACNWKIFMENFCESYHIFHVHKHTFEKNAPTVNVKVIPGGDGFNLHQSDLEDYAFSSTDYNPDLTQLPEAQVTTAPLAGIYPCTAVALEPTGTWMVTALPISTDQCTVEWSGILSPQNGDKESQSLSGKEFHDFLLAVMEEDRTVLERVQTGMYDFSPKNHYCHMERTTWEFGQYIARRLLQNEARADSTAG